MKMENATTQSALGINIESLKIALGVLLLFASSQIAIPIEPVPITMQTVGVMLIGLIYRRRSALVSVIVYTALGAVGLPVFQGFAGGLSHLYGPTAGYIVGFTASVYIMTTLRERFGLDSFWGILLNCVIGTLVVFACGVSWLASIVGIKDAITFGVIPFIIPGAVKAVSLSCFLRFVRGGKNALNS